MIMESINTIEINTELEELFDWLFKNNIVVTSNFLYGISKLESNETYVDKMFKDEQLFNFLVEIFYKNWLKNTPDYKSELKIARREKPKKEADKIVELYYKGLLREILMFRKDENLSEEYFNLIMSFRLQLIDYIRQVQNGILKIEY